MRQRSEAAVALSALAVLFVIAAATGLRSRSSDDPDRRSSSFLAGREGTRALADAAGRLGVGVRRWRARTRDLAAHLSAPATTFVVIAPTNRPSPNEINEILALANEASGADLVIVGASSEPLMLCLGYEVLVTVFDSSRVTVPGSRPDDLAAWTHATLVPTSSSPKTPPSPDSSRFGVEDDQGCVASPIARVDTLLTRAGPGLVMLRLHRRDSGRRILLVADASLVRNRVMRVSSTAPIMLDAIIGRSTTLAFDEYHHGFGPEGSLAGVTFAWSLRNPLGWMFWQLAIVGVIALIAGGIRFGTVSAAIPRTRRSPLEHVRALATALAASRGHDVAIGAIVRGLRRRLAPSARVRHGRDDWRPWLDSLVNHAPTARAEQRARELAQLARTGQPDAAVLSAATAVEDLWEELRP